MWSNTKIGERSHSPDRRLFWRHYIVVLTLSLAHSTIYTIYGSTRGCEKRSLLYYCAFRHHRATTTQPGTAQIIIPTTHVFRRKMVKNGCYGAKSKRPPPPYKMNNDAFSLPHTLNFPQIYTYNRYLQPFEKNILAISHKKIGTKPMPFTHPTP